MKPVDYAILAKRAYSDVPTVGRVDSASRMHVYGNAHIWRGSDDRDSWLHDLDIEVAKTPFGKIHAGFWSAWLVVREQVMALPAPSAVGGHSLGGPLCILEAIEWAQRDVIVPIFAFEPPRLCCDDTIRALIHEKAIPFYATRNGHDLVTQVPVNMTLPGPLVEIGKGVLPFDNIEDHSIDYVIQALAA